MRTNSRAIVPLMVASAVASIALLVIACVIIASVGNGPGPPGPPEPRERIDESCARADWIGVHLEVFKVCTGSYPQSLDELERELGVKLDRPTVAKWEYRPSADGSSYSIRICDHVYWEYYPSYTLYAGGEWSFDT